MNAYLLCICSRVFECVFQIVLQICVCNLHKFILTLLYVYCLYVCLMCSYDFLWFLQESHRVPMFCLCFHMCVRIFVYNLRMCFLMVLYVSHVVFCDQIMCYGFLQDSFRIPICVLKVFHVCLCLSMIFICLVYGCKSCCCVSLFSLCLGVLLDSQMTCQTFVH